MAEQVAAKKKRQRRVPSAAVLKITVERSETVWKLSRNWNKTTDDLNQRPQYEYVDATLPTTERVTILEQSLPESKFDLAKVIKAINGL